VCVCVCVCVYIYIYIHTNITHTKNYGPAVDRWDDRSTSIYLPVLLTLLRYNLTSTVSRLARGTHCVPGRGDDYPSPSETETENFGISPRISHTSLCDNIDITDLGRWKIDGDLTVPYVRV
jgi:hypothetical protein